MRGLLVGASPLDIVIYEKTRTAGTGRPYRQKTKHGALLANIASVELPAVLEPLEQWLQACAETGEPGDGHSPLLEILEAYV